MKRLLAAVTAALTLAAVPVLASPERGRAATVNLHDAAGLHVESVKSINDRLLAVVVTTKALPKPANIYILLPPGYSSSSARRYPVFYLLHGTSGTASDWTVKGNAQHVIGDRQLITVMPDIALDVDGGGWCTDWPNGKERWETFHIDQLIPWVDQNLHSITKRSQRAIAGLSQGGFCSMSYAARHPDVFGTALAYSGAPDIYYDTRDRLGAMAVINATEFGLDQEAPDTFFGDPVTNAINWAAHDPATLAENLRWTRMYLYWGNGQPGPYDTTPDTYAGSTIELLVWGSNNDFQARLNSLHIPAYFDAYGPGTHAWTYWNRDLKRSIDRIMYNFAHPAPTPRSFTYASADNQFAVYGWRVTAHRPAREFSTLTTDGRRSFTLAGSGAASVVTPPFYRPGQNYDVHIDGVEAGQLNDTVTADRDGRIHLEIRLGPGNLYQQETAEATVNGTAVYATTVTIL